VHDKFTLHSVRMSQKPKTKTQNSIPKSKSAVRSIDERRIQKLKVIQTKLKQGKHVQNRDLQTWLPVEEFESIAGLWEYEKDRRSMMYGEKPSEVKEYEERLAKAIFTFNRSEYFSNKGKHAVAGKLSDKSQSQFESALEWLEECYELDPSIRSWFDRDFDIANCSLDPDGVPRVITSRSLVRQHGVETQTIADIKLDVVNRALDDLCKAQPDEVAVKKARKKLEALLKMPDLNNFEL
jgi:hypothetical protein